MKDYIFHNRYKIVFLLIMSLLLNTNHFLFAQEPVKQEKIFKTWLTLKGNFKYKGILYSLNDSSITIANYSEVEQLSYYKLQHHTFLVNDIEMIKLRDTKKMRRSRRIGALVGASSGFVIGLIAGISENTNNSYGSGLITVG